MTPRWRLFPKYAVLIIALVGGMLIASGAIGIYFSYRESRASLVALQDEKAQAAATRIEQYVLDIEHQLSWTALPRMDTGGDALEQRRIEYLKLLRQAPAITEVAWLDPTGREQLRVSRLAMDVVGSGVDAAQQPMFREVTGSRVYYGPVYFRKGTEPYMTISRPAGSGGGVTAAEVNLKFVWDVVSRIKIGEAGLAYVVDSTGTLIAHPDISLVLKKTDLKSLPQVAALLRPDGDGQPIAVGIRGGKVLSAHSAIPTLRWTVFVESPEAEAFAPLYASIVRAALVLGAGLLVATTASFFLARALVRPLRELQEGAARIGAGELDRRIEVNTGDELEGLAEQFNKMGADLKASYAGLERKVQERTAELTEALEYQTAISAVLRVISESPTDVTPVFEAILGSATRLFGNPRAALMRYDGRLVHLVGTSNWPEGAVEDARRYYPGPPNPRMMSGRVLLSGAVEHVDDALLDPAYDHTTAQVGDWRRMVGAPLLKDGVAIGAIIVAWPDPGETPQRQADLLKTFADQAVIAIENVRLISETKEALDRQTATSEILRVISESPTDVRPVLESVAERSRLLCRADGSRVWLREGEQLRSMTGYKLDDGLEAGQGDALPLRPTSVIGRAFVERRVVHVEDIGTLVDTEYPDTRAMQRLHGFRTVLAVPMLREGVSVGTIGIVRKEVRPFSKVEIELVQTFADQAVIAIENVRLFNETKEALERQTATAEVLQVISSSVSDSRPVFEKILQSCQHLFDSSEQGILLVGDDGRVRLRAHEGSAKARLGAMFEGIDGVEIEASMRERKVLHYKDVLNDPDVPDRVRDVARHLDIGTYSQALAPMVWEGRAVGSIYIVRQPATGFSDNEIGLLKTFADQAAIAIQNARLFNETKEALEQQTASAEVLQVISSSVADTKPVFEKILDSCQHLFAADGLGIYLIDEAERLQMGGFRGNAVGAVTGAFPRPLEGTATEVAVRERRVVHYPDVLAARDVPAPLRRIAEAGGNFSIAFAPMLWEDRGVGAIQVSREPPSPFSAKELVLLKTFADQAVIAIQNSRLFNEIERKSRELEMANKHKSEFLANMSHELRTPLNAIIGFSEVLSEQMFGDVNPKQLEYLQDIHSSGHHLLTLINDILDLSKIEAGRMELELTCFDLGLLLDNSMTLVRERATRHGLTLALDVADDIEDWVADQRKVKQVVINLLSNAVKFTAPGGKVTLRARRLEGPTGDCVEIAVVDTGIGIAPDQQELVFEEFRQASGDYLRKTEGTGLGLSLARRFVELHGGAIRVESVLGRGSTFAFVLPRKTLAESPAIEV